MVCKNGWLKDDSKTLLTFAESCVHTTDKFAALRLHLSQRVHMHRLKFLDGKIKNRFTSHFRRSHRENGLSTVKTYHWNCMQRSYLRMPIEIANLRVTLPVTITNFYTLEAETEKHVQGHTLDKYG